jgi:hypothetical protein
MPHYKPRETQEEYDPITFDLAGEKHTVIPTLDEKLMKRVYDLDMQIMKSPEENMTSNMRQLAIFIGKPETYFIGKNLDLRDVKGCLNFVMSAIDVREVKKKKKK